MRKSTSNVKENRAIGKAAFNGLMAALGPYEQKPHIAIACSGGGDSMALALLTDIWAKAHGGAATALIVDHGIRAESAAEAKAVAEELSRHRIKSEVLRHTGPRIRGDIQAAARNIRYDLLTGWCAARGYLHLAVAHHLEDQAETALLRLSRGSGVDGLAAMAPVVETRSLRIIRPLLQVPRAKLELTLERRKVRHVDDPSNRDNAFARVRIRKLSAALAEEGMTPHRLAATASNMARARTAIEGDVAAVLARTTVLFPQGFGRVSTDALQRAPEEIALRALSRLLMCVGGSDYTPRMIRVERLYDWIRDGAPSGGRTLSGCRVLPREDGLLVCREASAARTSVPARGDVFWDGRFRMRFTARARGEIRRLGGEGWRCAVTIAPELRNLPIPSVVRPSLPAIWESDRLRSVPHLGLFREKRLPLVRHPHRVVFSPRRPLAPARFTLQKGEYTLSK